MHAHEQRSQGRSERREHSRPDARQPAAAPRPRSVGALQRAIGNAAVVRLLGRQEQAEQPVQAVQPVQRAAVQQAQQIQQAHQVHQVLRSPGRPLAEDVRSEMEARLSADFSGVRIHEGAAAARSAAGISARAYTSGEHIVLGRGGGDKHTLAHELTHVIQQRSGTVAGTDHGDGLSVSDPGDRFERAAEANAGRVLSRAVPRTVRPAAPQARSAAPGPAVQRAFTGKPYVNYGGVNGNGVGTSMHAELWPGQLGKGSKPSVQPSWWPTGSGATAQWFSNFMVQGHLLNEQVGGPGNTMSNLTPLCKSANSAHHAKVEKSVKAEVLTNGNVVEYAVTADYSTHPAGADFAPLPTAVENDIDTNYSAKLAGSIEAEYTVYDTAGTELYGDAWQIENNRL
ncbi:eCIS core domain-containing protein [Streptomyces sp. NRRL F-5123]|uniref:eCIS core domain-containing protein n=1 Tax=Streptomyces sp. NRRL F-5123 TaxID=1463856 RepID=UPI0007C56573|nr:DUF4157 domain-containing protein [Streptomyces sp. NRRL F-5123]